MESSHRSEVMALAGLELCEGRGKVTLPSSPRSVCSDKVTELVVTRDLDREGEAYIPDVSSRPRRFQTHQLTGSRHWNEEASAMRGKDASGNPITSALATRRLGESLTGWLV